MSISFSKNPYASTSYSGADMLATITVRDVSSRQHITHTLGDLQTLSYSTHMARGAVRNFGNINVADFTNGPRTVAGSLVFAVFNQHMIQDILSEMHIQHQLLPDELPPFDITITFANEYGHTSVLRIYGVRLVNEGKVVSTNDVYIENTYQYVAHHIDVLREDNLGIHTTEHNQALYEAEQVENTSFDATDFLSNIASSEVAKRHAIYSNTTYNDITPVLLDAPYVTSRTSNTVAGVTTNELTQFINCYKDGELITIAKVHNHKFEITQLLPCASYALIAQSESEMSNPTFVKTLPLEADLHCGFEYFLKSNALLQEAYDGVLTQAAQSNLPFIEAMHNASCTLTTKEYLMQLANFYWLTLSQKYFSFAYQNKWLCDLAKQNDATSYRIQCDKGMSRNLQATQGLIELSQSHNQLLEKLTIYKTPAEYLQQIQSAYIANQSQLAIEAEKYEAQYGALFDVASYDFYDNSLSSDGCYIEIIGNTLKAHNVREGDNFVFKEDLSVVPAFKVSTSEVVDLEHLAFYCAQNTYVVYLERNNQPISKAIVLGDTHTYSYGTLFKKAVDCDLLELIQEICVEKLDLFETFCYGFYLLINRNISPTDYIALFDSVFYTAKKASYVPYHIQDNKLIFEEDVLCLLFDKDALYLSRHLTKEIPLQSEGFLLWCTSQHTAHFENFAILQKGVKT